MAGTGRHSTPATGDSSSDSTGDVPVVSFVAPSGTGKTTLISAVIERLTGMGLRVGAIKHDAHRIELDTKGKDSWRLRQAGASETLLIGANQMAWMGSNESAPDLRELLPLVQNRVDIVLVEGFRAAGLPAILVERPEKSDAGWEPPPTTSVIATVHPADVDAVADLLVSRYNLPVAQG